MLESRKNDPDVYFRNDYKLCICCEAEAQIELETEDEELDKDFRLSDIKFEKIITSEHDIKLYDEIDSNEIELENGWFECDSLWSNIRHIIKKGINIYKNNMFEKKNSNIIGVYM